MPNFKDFELDLKKVKTNSGEGTLGFKIKTAIISYNKCSMNVGCPSGPKCSPGDMTIGYAADKENI